MPQNTDNLILASQSSGRRHLLESARYTFDVRPTHVEEPTGENVTDIRQFVQHVSWIKAAAAAERHDDCIIIAADSVGWAQGQVIGKPTDEEHARRILKLLGGTDHELWTGVTLWRRPDNLQIIWQESSTVHFRGMTDAEIDEYLQTRVWRSCSGAYTVLGDEDPYVRVVQGSVSNVIGLPMESFAERLPLLTGGDRIV